MKTSIGFVLVLLAAASAGLAEDGYYKTKADARAGRKTPGKRPQVASSTPRPNPGTDGCPGTPITTLPFTDAGDTTGLTNDVDSLPAGCSTYTVVSGPDVVYSFTVAATNSVTFTLTPDPSLPWDPAIYVLGTCGVSASCIRGSDTGLAGDPETIGPTPAYPAGTHAFYVDSFYVEPDPFAHGAYTLAVAGSLPVELIKFAVE